MLHLRDVAAGFSTRRTGEPAAAAAGASGTKKRRRSETASFCGLPRSVFRRIFVADFASLFPSLPPSLSAFPSPRQSVSPSVPPSVPSLRNCSLPELATVLPSDRTASGHRESVTHNLATFSPLAPGKNLLGMIKMEGRLRNEEGAPLSVLLRWHRSERRALAHPLLFAAALLPSEREPSSNFHIFVPSPPSLLPSSPPPKLKVHFRL